MKTLLNLTEADLKDKRALVRVDWNVPIQDDKVVDDFRIKESLETINYLKGKGAKVILISHLEPEDASLKPVYEAAKAYIPELTWEEESDISILENLRQNPGEKANDPGFAASLASLADIYINEAFSVSHREHASMVSVPKLLPSYAGIHFMQEIKHLSRFFNPDHPFLFILGGAKFDTKLPLLKKFVDIADSIFVGGALANDFLRENGLDIKQSLVSEETYNLKPLLDTKKIILPDDFVWSEDKIVDIGPKSLEAVEMKIKSAAVILWNGPLGLYEKGFKTSTLEVCKSIAESGNVAVIGGVDTVASTEELNNHDKFTFVSSAGGAMLDYHANETLPGIEALA